MKKLTMAAVALWMLGAAELSAQQETATASVTIPEILAISLDNLSIAFPDATASDFETGYVTVTTGSAPDTRGNVSHDVMIRTTQASFDFTPSGSEADPSKPAADLEWSPDAGTTWTGLSQTAVSVLGGATLNPGQYTDVATIEYRIKLLYSVDVPGDYSLPIQYTVVAN